MILDLPEHDFITNCTLCRRPIGTNRHHQRARAVPFAHYVIVTRLLDMCGLCGERGDQRVRHSCKMTKVGDITNLFFGELYNYLFVFITNTFINADWRLQSCLFCCLLNIAKDADLCNRYIIIIFVFCLFVLLIIIVCLSRSRDLVAKVGVAFNIC